MRVNLAGKKPSPVKPNQVSAMTKESEYYLDLENEDKKSYKEKSTL